MKLATLALVVALSTQPVHLEAWDLSDLFKPKKKKVVKRVRHKANPKAVVTPAIPKGYFTVDHEWMAHYWILEAEWDYPIPEDKDIKYLDGKYHVPAVVYRHKEDMMKAKRE